MKIYSYYYGARAENGIGIQAQSRQLEELPIRPDLDTLASMHALESADRDSEMLSYFLQRSGYRILGLSYIETPKSSGYNRSAPCSLQYIAAENEMQSVGDRLGEVVNFINFQKPASPSPAPLAAYPLNESGYYYHNSRAVLAPLVDGLVRAALSTHQEVMLIALPKGKNSTYATARYTIAEALSYLPVPLRLNIRFFTGLPVGEGVSDHQIGYENAVKFGANVIFCPNEYYGRLKNYYSFIGLDMDHPSAQVGQFASYVTQTTDPSAALLQISRLLNGTVTYDSLNQAAAHAMQGETVTVDSLKLSLDRSEKRCRELERELDTQNRELDKRNRECQSLQNANNDLTQKNTDLVQKNNELTQRMRNQPPRHTERAPQPKRPSVFARILLVFLVIVLMALAGFAGWMIATRVHTGSFFPPHEEQPQATVDPNASLIPPTDTETPAPGDQETGMPTDNNPADDDQETGMPADSNPADDGDSNADDAEKQAATNADKSITDDQQAPDASTIQVSTENASETSPVSSPSPDPNAPPQVTTETAASPAPGDSEIQEPEGDSEATTPEQPVSSVSPTSSSDPNADAENDNPSPGPEDVGIINEYRKINGEGVRMRTTPNIDNNNNIVSSLKKDTYIWVAQTVKNDKGEVWAEVYVFEEPYVHKGDNEKYKKYYISNDYLTPLSEQENDSYQQQHPVPYECLAQSTPAPAP